MGGLKSPLVFYEVKNPNGAITHEAFFNQILEKEVTKWIQRGNDLIFEQDGASGNGGGPKARQNKPATVWFSEKGVEICINCPDSAHLASVENC